MVIETNKVINYLKFIMVNIQLHPVLQGKWNENDVINPYGHALLILDPIPKGQKYPDSIFILVEDVGYSLEIGISNNAFFIKRNLDSISYPLDEFPNNVSRTCLAVWNTEKLQCSMTDDVIYSSADAISNTNIMKNFKSINTQTTLPPFSLIKYCRKQLGLSQITYADESIFFSTMISSFQNIQDTIDFSNSRDAFWEVVVDGKTETRKPRLEVSNQNLIHALLHTLKVVKNFELISGPKSGGGELDFLLIGTLESGIRVKVCVEFKNAHSPKLEHGLLKQLPEYMKLNGSNLGIYMILNFKDSEFQHPKKSETELDFELSKKAMDVGLGKIRILCTNFGKKPSPSKIP